jgi:two-component system CheB/CheR fusion protein
MEPAMSDETEPSERLPGRRANAKADAQCLVVGIGASAGGLPALEHFFAALPPDSGLAFVVIMHLAPERESYLATLLQRYTAMTVMQVTETTPIEPNRVYVIPPNCNLAQMGAHLQLIPLDEERHARAPIDFFFRTLAEHRGDGVAIILSGSGSDGALGIKAIKEHGGLLMVQDPVEAEYDGMPQSAIATGLVDVILPVEELARELLNYQQTRKIIKLPDEPAALPDEEQDAIRQILAQLQLRTGHDFSQYKRSTVLRRIGRRMQVTHNADLKSYLSLLRRSPAEAALLFQDLLIGVTSFFRDGETFDILAAEIIPQLFANKDPGDVVRVWVVGCATGEEAYSLAFLLLEQAAKVASAPEVQLFATDLDEQALHIARQGVYPATVVADITEERLERFFTREDDQVRVKAEVRERVLFALHNVIKEPPFSRLDLISCRNLLIYLQPELQERVFRVFHYALRPQGYLLLGSAESAESAPELFVTRDKKHCIYQRREGASAQPVLLSLPATPVSAARPASILPLLNRRSGATLHYQMLEEFAPPSLLVDEQLMVLHLSENAGRYLLPPGGSLTGDISRLIRPELQAGLRSALYQALEQGRSTITPPVPVLFNGSPHLVSLAVRPRRQAGDGRLALVTFLEDERDRLADGLDSAETHERDATIRRLAEELRHEHEQLQAMQEEHETSEEELRASNEELQSTNEEYKSTLEELETSKEELQSINEELLTVNQELKDKVEEVSQAHSDLQNLLAATDIATLFLDQKLAIQRYTPGVMGLFNLIPTDRGRPIGHLKARIRYATLEADARRVLQGQELVECEVQSEAGRWFLVRMHPYRTADERIDGVVITFFDLTERRQAQERFRQVIEQAPNGMLVVDGEGRIGLVNTAVETAFGYGRAELLGQSVDLLLPFAVRSDHAAYRDHYFAQPTARPMGAERELFGRHKDGHEFPLEIGLAPIETEQGVMTLATVVDISERKRAEERQGRLLQQVEQQRTLLRTLNRTLAHAQEQERQELARNLHDLIGQNLTALNLSLKLIQTQLAAGPPVAKSVDGRLQEARKLVEQLTEQVRDVMSDLRPPMLADYGLLAALRWYAKQFARRTGLAIDVQGEQPFPRLPEEMELVLFRIAQEAFNNVAKHAQATQMTITLAAEDSQVRLTVADNGRGMALADAVDSEQPQGWGMLIMRERAEAIGGRFRFQSELDKGTTIEVEINR